jgi:hypothetical protein
VTIATLPRVCQISFTETCNSKGFEFDFYQERNAMDNSETISRSVNRSSFLKKGVLGAGAAAVAPGPAVEDIRDRRQQRPPPWSGAICQMVLTNS